MVSLIPLRQLQRKGHDRWADDRADAVKTVQEVHHGGWIMIRYIMIHRRVDGACAEAVGNGKQEQHPILP